MMRGKAKSMGRSLGLVGLACTLFGLQGCATIAGGGPKQDIAIITLPSRAQVKVDGVGIGPTPVIARLDRKSAKVITIEAQGYHPYEIVLERGFNPWAMGNLFFPLGWLIDWGTGAIYKLSPEQLGVELRERRWDGVEAPGAALSPASFTR